MIFISSIEFQDRISEIKNLFAEGNTNRVVKRLLDISRELNHREGEIHAMNISSRYQLLHGEYYKKSVITYETFTLECNKINDSILIFLDELRNYYNSEEKTQNIIKSDKSKDELKSMFTGKEIHKEFENFELSNINLDIKERTITGLVGENGSGKTTLLKILSGMLASDRGELNYFGNESGDWFNIKQQIAYISQVPPLWIMPLKDVLFYYCKIKTGLGHEEVSFEVDRIINRLGLKFFEFHEWGSLSGGYKTRFEIARAIIGKPKLLILDEPLAHLDPIAQSIFLQDIKDIVYESNPPMAAIISSQHIQEIELIADELLVLSNGETKFQGDKNLISKKYMYQELEITCDLEAKLLTAKMKKLNSEIDIIQKGIYNILTIPHSVKVNDVISFLISEGVKIEYIKDISESSKRIL